MQTRSGRALQAASQRGFLIFPLALAAPIRLPSSPTMWTRPTRSAPARAWVRLVRQIRRPKMS